MTVTKKRVLGVALFVVLLTLCDTLRSPESQLTARAYIGAVHIYQDYGRPLLDGYVACRFRPTCSEYSVQAVERYGIWKGLYMTINRLMSCTNDVPMGTVDSVP